MHEGGMMETERWDFAPSVSNDRVEKLRAAPGLESIAESIRCEMSVLCCHSDPRKQTNMKRVAYCIRVPNELFDLFFNSRTGYRACYYRTPFGGLHANSRVLELLTPALLAAAETKRCDLGPRFIRESLRSLSAKVWLAERGKTVSRDCAGCEGEWGAGLAGDYEPDILNGRWELSQDPRAGWGRKAPYLTKLRVLGAFLDGDYNEFIPAEKRFRAQELFEFGWS